MKSIAGSVVVLGACVLIATAATAGWSEVAENHRNYRNAAMGAGFVLAALGLFVTFAGSRDGK